MMLIVVCSRSQEVPKISECRELRKCYGSGRAGTPNACFVSAFRLFPPPHTHSLSSLRQGHLLSFSSSLLSLHHLHLLLSLPWPSSHISPFSPLSHFSTLLYLILSSLPPAKALCLQLLSPLKGPCDAWM